MALWSIGGAPGYIPSWLRVRRWMTEVASSAFVQLGLPSRGKRSRVAWKSVFRPIHTMKMRVVAVFINEAGLRAITIVTESNSAVRNLGVVVVEVHGTGSGPPALPARQL